MKHIRQTLILIAVVAVLVCQNAQAVVFRISSFTSYNTGNLGADAGTGTLDGWQNSINQVTLTNGSGSLIGTNLGLVASAGDRVFISNVESTNTRNQYVPNGTFPQSAPTNIYYSFLYQFNNAADVSGTGEKIFQVNRANSGVATGIHWELFAMNVAGQIQIGVGKTGGTINYAPTNIAAGQTVFVVLRQQIITGTANDVYDLWIDPPTNTFGVDELSVPLPSASVGVTEGGAEDQSTTGPGRFWVCSGANAMFDEVRIASSWDQVTPPFGQCLSPGFDSNPTNATVVAGINATFRVTPAGTSPSIQWQLSTNGGTIWTNVLGNAAIFVTPNLTLANNNNKYRAIVTVPCDGSSATSSVATVTVTAPVVTPPGLIMDDNFDDQLRDNLPIATNNSVWRTANSPSLDAITMDLIGTPASLSSSLWLGYFVDDSVTNLPVHLAIGNTIKVTFPFTPNGGIAASNVGASLRFGLFDYADGGTRLIADNAAAGGSLGNGIGVRGYMVAVQFGTTNFDTTPMEVYARSFLDDNNLMGTTGDFISLASGPGNQPTNSPIFQSGTQYTLEMSVTRINTNATSVTVSISGLPTNWVLTAIDNNFAYHRFDAFGIRPNSLETTADSFTFPNLHIDVLAPVVGTITISNIQPVSPTGTRFSWNSAPGVAYQVQSRDSLTAGNWTTNATIFASTTTTSFTNAPLSVSQRYYRVVAPPF